MRTGRRRSSSPSPRSTRLTTSGMPAAPAWGWPSPRKLVSLMGGRHLDRPVTSRRRHFDLLHHLGSRGGQVRHRDAHDRRTRRLAGMPVLWSMTTRHSRRILTETLTPGTWFRRRSIVSKLRSKRWSKRARRGKPFPRRPDRLPILGDSDGYFLVDKLTKKSRDRTTPFTDAHLRSPRHGA